MIELTDVRSGAASIRVVGVGGGGNNALNTMILGGLEGVDFIAANTDSQALSGSLASIKIQMGETLTRGLGAGANPEVGRNATIESKDRLAEALEGADMVFITAGMGGGTGTGGAPVIAEVARSFGCLTVGVVTRPFQFEGKRRARQAAQGIQELRQVVDTLITIPNQKLIELAGENTSILDAFSLVDRILYNAVQGISDLVVVRGMINVDFADVRTVMHNQGLALMGTGIATGPKRAIEAAHAAINSPLLEEVAITGATGVLLNVTAGPDLKLHEVNEAACFIQEQTHEEANIIFGAVMDAKMGDQLKVTVIATGFESQPELVTERPRTGVFQDNLDVPTHIRRNQRVGDPRAGSPFTVERPNARTQNRPATPPKSARECSPVSFNPDFSTSFVEEEQFDIPAFLRKTDR